MSNCSRSIILGATVMLMPFLVSAAVGLPKSVEVDRGELEAPCLSNEPEWRLAQTVVGIIVTKIAV